MTGKPRGKTPETQTYLVRQTARDYPKVPSGPFSGARVYAGADRRFMGVLYHDGRDVLGFLAAMRIDTNAMQTWWRDTLRGAYAVGSDARDVWAYWLDHGNLAMDLAGPETFDTMADLVKVLAERP